MVNPFFKNTGPFKVFEILNLLNLDTKKVNSDFIWDSNKQDYIRPRIN